MSVPVWVWGLTVLGVLGLMVFDFYAHVRTPHEPTFRESAFWSVFYIALALVFGVGLLLVWGPSHGGEYFAGYVTEKSLSVDNLFVFLIIMTRFAVPRIYQQKVLLVGVAIALFLRGLFIWAGAAAIEQFSWVFYLFGAFLIYTAVKLAREDHDSEAPSEYHENRLLRLVRRVLPSSPEYHGDRLTVVEGGKRLVTPMLIVMVAIGSTDVLFALDSIPAIYGLTKEPYIVFTTNAFALLGLRQLYFLLGGLLQRLVYLSEGLSFILAFIGVKLVLEALHTNELPFVNGGEPVGWAPEIPIWLSLTVILGTLTIATVASLVSTRRAERASDAAASAPVATGDETGD
ncbi:TerC family protein [Actinotalea fermentans]|uniref:Tellurium resistance protein TerC n=1 Tax=Actinotalea fermentans TaxID=43671 RepID=A0A511YV23_9CELL|nr:TerC family protein [Actinotalea fermentans]KGM17241.1 tellurium resistance protein TerC [Actinotalea fermentans ATCC 43279 = JCM 9966 = DSM 3133]GEN79037.1 tellurium resistance protein TerC [Actinotalea fermentans]